MMQRNTNNSATSSLQSACAACKHQRKKCNEDCKLARYFPADRNREFQSVHKVFGVSNVTKIIHSVNDEESRKRVVDSLIWESYWRQKDPVLGPYGEYKRVFEELKLCRNQNLMQSQNQNQLVQLPQRGIIYRPSPPPPLVGLGWNGGNGMIMDGIVDDNTLNYNPDNGNGNGNSIVEMDGYVYPVRRI